MGRSSPTRKRLRPFEEALAPLRQHYLLGAVAKHATVRARHAAEPEWRARSEEHTSELQSP